MLCHVRRCAAVVALLGALLVAAAAGSAPVAEPIPPAAAPGAEAAPDSLTPAPDTPLAREVRETRARFQAELKRLTGRYDAAATSADALAVQRAIAALKSQDEIDILAIQSRYARAAGLTERADEIDDLLARLRAGAPDGAPPAAAR